MEYETNHFVCCADPSLVCSGTAKMEDAADLYVRAANAYKVGKKYKG